LVKNSLHLFSLQLNAYNTFKALLRLLSVNQDYGGMVWHGTYMTWLEEARVECLSSIGVSFADFVSIGCDIIVVDISLRYQKPLSLGDVAIVRACLKMQGIKIIWEYKIQSPDAQVTYLAGTITLVPIDHQKKKIMRKLPPIMQDALNKLLSPTIT
jgi:acyl-CoA thioester hydrolase